MTRSSSNGEDAVNRANSGGGLAALLAANGAGDCSGKPRWGDRTPILLSSTCRDEAFGIRVRS